MRSETELGSLCETDRAKDSHALPRGNLMGKLDLQRDKKSESDSMFTACIIAIHFRGGQCAFRRINVAVEP